MPANLLSNDHRIQGRPTSARPKFAKFAASGLPIQSDEDGFPSKSAKFCKATFITLSAKLATHFAQRTSLSFACVSESR